MKRLMLSILILFLTGLVAPTLASGESVLWQVGAQDHSAAEFALAGHYTDYKRDFAGGTAFYVGKSDPSKDWVCVHPGPKDEAWAGSGDHPYEIIFDLATVPKGPLALIIAVLDTNPKDPPMVRLRVNEVTREYRLKGGSSRASIENYKSGPGQVLRMYVAGGFLREGRNVVNIRVVDGSWLLYDYVSLVSIAKAPNLAENLSARPTFLFVRKGGALKQVVRASLDLCTDQPSMNMRVGYGQSDVSGLAPNATGDLPIDRMRDILAHYMARKDYPFDAILLHGGYGDNNENTESMPRAAQMWNSVYEYPKIIFCRGSEFFEYIESKFASHIPTVKGDGGVYWEDGAASSARESAITRTAKETLDQWAVKKSFADNAYGLSDKLLRAAMDKFRYPDVRLEIPDGVIRPEVDQLPGACKNWYCVGQFVTLADHEAAVTWTAIDSPLVTFGDINRGKRIDSLRLVNGNVFAYVMNNYWFTNYKASQGGPLTFRFATTSAKTTSDTNAKRFGESVHSQLLSRFVRGVPAANGRAQSGGFLELTDDGVVVQALKQARFSNGTIVRVREMGGKTAKATLRINRIKFKRAFLCNMAEDKLTKLDVNKGAVVVPCRAFGLATVLLER